MLSEQRWNEPRFTVINGNLTGRCLDPKVSFCTSHSGGWVGGHHMAFGLSGYL